MSGEVNMKNPLVRCIVYTVVALCLICGDSYAAVAPAKSVKKTVANVAVKTVPTPAAKQAVKGAVAKIPTPPPMVGVQKVVSPDSSKNLVPDKSKLVAKAKSFTEAIQDLEKQKAKANKGKAAAAKPLKKKVKSRKQVVDALLNCWANRGVDAESAATNAARKLVGNKNRYLIKDSTYIVDGKRVICQLRINFSTYIPETWYLETEMVTGFSTTKERAYNAALEKAQAKANKVQSVADWANSKAESTAMNGSEMGVIPYSITFATVNKEVYCKLFFRYFMPR